MTARITIVGGGFTAATLAIQLLRRTAVPLDIAVVEPREHLGRGLAYSAIDPDHRLNGSVDAHCVDPEQPDALRQWCMETGLFHRDPECLLPNGHAFIRRGDFGEFLSDQLAKLASERRLGSTVRHVRDLAVAATVVDGQAQVTTANGSTVAGALMVIATGNPPQALRFPLDPKDRSRPQFIAQPLEPGSLDRVPADAKVLVVGGGLTALDVVSTLIRQQRARQIHVVSRHGLRPRPQAPAILSFDGTRCRQAAVVDLHRPIPDYLKEVPRTARHWCVALRAEIGRAADAGRPWQEPFDAVRDVVWRLWPQLPLDQKLRFLRRLRVFYDVHRFRAPPTNLAIVLSAEAQGRVTFSAASVASVRYLDSEERVEVELLETASAERTWSEFDAVINCTGLDWTNACLHNPVLQSLVDQGRLRRHPTGMGFDVSVLCEALDCEGSANPLLRVVGPPTSGVFGDPLGVSFIAGQAQRIVPDILSTLTARQHRQCAGGC